MNPVFVKPHPRPQGVLLSPKPVLRDVQASPVKPIPRGSNPPNNLAELRERVNILRMQ
jgi:hypothetical protein